MAVECSWLSNRMTARSLFRVMAHFFSIQQVISLPQINGEYSMSPVIHVIPPSKLDANGDETLLETIKISNAGEIRLTYGDGMILNAGTVALANFANSGGLKPVEGVISRPQKSLVLRLSGHQRLVILVKSSKVILRCPTPM